MADEEKILLKIDADAARAKQALAETKTGVEQLGQATSTAGGAEAVKQTTDALAGQGEAAGKAATETEKLAQQTDAFNDGAAAMRTTLNAIHNPLSFLMNLATKGREAIAALLSPQGLAVAGLLATIMVVERAIQDVVRRVKEAEDRAKGALAALRQEQQKEAGRTEEIGDVLGRAGISSEAAVRGAALIERQMIGRGFKTEAVRKVLPLAVGPGGEQMVSDEELEQLAAMAEFAPEQIAEARRPGEVGRARRTTLDRIRRRADDVQMYQDAVAGRQSRRQQAVQQNQAWAIRQKLEQAGEVLPVGQEDQIIQDIIDLAENGSISRPDYTVTTGYSAAWREEMDRAARYGELAEVVSPEQASAARKMTLSQKAWQVGTIGRIGRAVGRGVSNAGKSLYGGPANITPWGDTGAPAAGPTVIYNFHGPTYTGSPGDAFAREQRGG
jgi:hypothetical protein